MSKTIRDLAPGTTVCALKPLDEAGAHVAPGEVGTILEAANAEHGPLVRWPGGRTCNVYEGQVAEQITEPARDPQLGRLEG